MQFATGSDKSYPFVIDAKNQPDTVCVCESPIEAMSLYTLHELIGSPHKGAYIISLGGSATNSLDYFLLQHKDIKNIVVSTNNDKDKVQIDKITGKEIITNAGKESRAAIKLKYGNTYNVSECIPHLNDWSDVLKDLRKIPAFKLPEPKRQKDMSRTAPNQSR